MDMKQMLDKLRHKACEYVEKVDVTTLKEFNAVCEEYMDLSEGSRRKNASKLISMFEPILLKVRCDETYYVIMTFLLHATESIYIYKLVLDYCRSDNFISKETRFFLYYQFVQFNFLHPNVVDDEISELIDNLYGDIYQEYYKVVADSYDRIPKEDRNKDLVFVFTSQVLNEMHAPTKTLLDRCYILETVLNKRVFIINTAELLSSYMGFYTFRAVSGTYEEALSNLDSYPYKGRKFMFFQCPQEMPQVDVIRQILEVVKSEKPYFILNIGGSSITSDLCSNIIPSVTLATVFSGRATTRGQFQAVGREINEDDRKWMAVHNLNEDHMIESLFTFAFKKQEHTYTRNQLGLPEEGFVAVLTGARLSLEVDGECIELLLRLMRQNIYVAFMGKFDMFDELSKEHEVFRQYAINLGFQEDVLAVYECCDLYINPKRSGGGSSAAEALYKGLPVVALNYGDVGTAVGEEFHVSSYDDMYERVLQYSQDKVYYHDMSIKAKARAERLLDSTGEFVKIIEKVEESPYF